MFILLFSLQALFIPELSHPRILAASPAWSYVARNFPSKLYCNTTFLFFLLPEALELPSRDLEIFLLWVSDK